jgi:hypothetical protein
MPVMSARLPLPIGERGRALRALGLMCASMLLLSACSMPRLLYSQADWLLMRHVNGYLDLDSAQSARLADAIASGLRRHRAEELPLIAETLRDFAASARSGLRPHLAHDGIARMRMLAMRSAELGIEPLSATLVGLDTRQRARMAERLERRNRDYHERHALDAPSQLRLERRTTQGIERIEYWTGPLTEPQIELIRAAFSAMPDSAAQWLAYTQARQDELLRLLQADAPAHEVAQLLRGSWLHNDDLPQALAHNRQRQLEAWVDLLVRLDATLNSTQRAHLVGRLEKLARDAEQLSAREA